MTDVFKLFLYHKLVIHS